MLSNTVLDLAGFFPYVCSAQSLNILGIQSRRIPENELIRFTEYIENCAMTYLDLYDNINASMLGTHSEIPFFNIFPIVLMLKPALNNANVVVKRWFTGPELRSFFDGVANQSKDKSLTPTERSHLLEKLYNRVEPEIKTPERKKVLVANGPYKLTMYNDPTQEEKADAYDLHVHQQRVADIKDILHGVSGHIVALADGAGTALDAVKEIGRADLTCTSYDGSDTMCKIGLTKYNNNIIYKKNIDVELEDDDIVFISHVVEYDPELIDRLKDHKLIVFERMTVYKYCWLLKPYYKDRGWCLATRNFELYNVSISSKLPYNVPCDYKVFGVVAHPSIRRLDILGDVPSNYRPLIDDYNKLLDTRQDAQETAYISTELSNVEFLSIPGIGPIDNFVRVNLASVAPEIVRFNLGLPRLAVRNVAVSSVFLTGLGAEVFILGRHTRYRLNPVAHFSECCLYKVKKKKYRCLELSKDTGLVTVAIEGCTCGSVMSHSHILTVANSYTTLILNAEGILRAGGVTKTKLNLYGAFSSMFSNHQHAALGAMFTLCMTHVDSKLLPIDTVY